VRRVAILIDGKILLSVCGAGPARGPAIRVPECFVSLISVGELQQLVSTHGYWVVALIVGLESMGLPLPGETILVLAAIYAATEPSFNVWVVIAERHRQKLLDDLDTERRHFLKSAFAAIWH
jgi:hypothetical protein